MLLNKVLKILSEINIEVEDTSRTEKCGALSKELIATHSAEFNSLDLQLNELGEKASVVHNLSMKEKVILLTEFRVLIMNLTSELDEFSQGLDEVISCCVREGGLDGN